eukprot:COSAG05_NODE_520_length_9047_cov_2.500224_11_plen_37_part_00
MVARLPDLLPHLLEAYAGREEELLPEIKQQQHRDEV